MMLDYIRGNAQSWGVKLAFLIIILVFVFWGVGRMHDTGQATAVAQVNGENIPVQDLFHEMQRLEENIRMAYPNLNSEQVRALNLQAQAEQMLIFSTLLRQEAGRTGFAVTPLELRRTIEKNPAFHNAKGEFDPQTYLRVLEVQRTTPGAYESRVSRDLLQQKFYAVVAAPFETSEKEARALFDFAKEQRQVSYLIFPFAEYSQQVFPGEDEVRAEYESNRAAFAVPASCDAEYVPVSPKSLARPDTVKEEEIAAWYERNKASAVQPERLHLRHILLTLAPDAPEADVKKAQNRLAAAAAKIQKGEAFAAVAAQLSQDPGSASKGGDLGWIRQGETVPAFEQAAWALENDRISEPVRTDFGLHLIKLETREAERTRSLDEMRTEIRSVLAEQKAAEHLRDVLDQLVEANIVGTPLERIAATLNLEVRRTGLSTDTELQNKLGVDAKGAAALLKAPVGTGPDTPLEVKGPDGTGFIVARINAATPEKTRELAEVKNIIIEGLKEKKARALAHEAAERIRKDMDAELPPALRGRLLQASPVGRAEPVAELGRNTELEQAVFSAQTGAWLGKAFNVDKGAVLLRLDACIPPGEESWNAVSDAFMNSLAGTRKEESFQIFARLLAEKSRIERNNINLENVR